MASRTARPAPGSHATPTPSSLLLLLLLSLGQGLGSCKPGPGPSPQPRTLPCRGALPPTAQVAETAQEPEPFDRVVANTSDLASLSPRLLRGLTCASVSRLSPERAQELARAVGREKVTLRGQAFPQGYPENVVRDLLYLFYLVSLEDIGKWNVMSLVIVESLLRVVVWESQWQDMIPQVTALLARFLAARGQLNTVSLRLLVTLRPAYVCLMPPEQLGSVPPQALWAVEPQDLATCRPQQLDSLYPKARSAFQNLTGLSYYERMRPYLTVCDAGAPGGAREAQAGAGAAPMEDLRALRRRNVSVDVATLMRLRKEALLALTVEEVRGLLGPHIGGLKAMEWSSPMRDWLVRQPQGDLDTLGLGLLGSIPNGYLVLDLDFQGGRGGGGGWQLWDPSPAQAPSGGPQLLGPRPLLASLSALLLAVNLS